MLYTPNIMITKYLKRNNTFILIIVLLLIASFIVPNFIAYKFEQKRIEEQRILEGMAFFGPDVMNIINNMIDMILGVVDMAFGISDFITGLANMVLDVLTQAVAFANSILNAAITAITSASAIVQGLFAAFIVAGIAATIVFLGENIANWFEGVGNHIRCGGEEFGVGWYNTFKTLSSHRITAGDVQLGENLNIFPNPTRGLFNISFIAEKVDNFESTIIDAFGKLVFQEEKQDFIGEYTKQVDLSDATRGIYMLQIKTQNSFVSKRIVLQ